MPAIKIVIDKLELILKENRHVKLNEADSKIVGCTIATEGIEPLYAKYPILEEIAELGASLETEKELEHQQALLALIKQKLEKLKELR